MINLPNGLFNFQEECISFLLEKTTELDMENHREIIVKSPTGSGKTIMLIAYVDRYIDFVYDKTVFVWLGPGEGELEEQSKEKMESVAPHLITKDIQDVLTEGFTVNATHFINWQMVTSRKNKAITENERKNLYDRIDDSHREGVNFIVIVDEEHRHNTAKANEIINRFSPKVIIRVSATAKKKSNSLWYEIQEEEVIQSGLITKAMYVNEGVDIDRNREMSLSNESEYLLKMADNKRKEILNEYKNMNKDIRPLVIVQFPNSSTEQIERVEKQLEKMGYNYDNKMVAKWMADEEDKVNIKGITEKNATPAFLLIKQAISTGWDNPRAKILVKLRENMNEDFEIQTIGRIRRMPEAKHYDNEILDCCYLYTFDEEYKESILQDVDNSYEVKRLFLRNKEQTKDFVLTKQLRDLDFDGISIAEIFNNIIDHFRKKYKLTDDLEENKKILKIYGFVMGEVIQGKFKQGRFITFKELATANDNYTKFEYKVDTKENRLDLLYSIDLIKSSIGMSQESVRAILRKLFSKTPKSDSKLLSLNKREWYAFIINNAKKIRDDLMEVSTKTDYQLSFISTKIEPKEIKFRIPEEDKFRFDPNETDIEEYMTNVYKDYTTQMTTDNLRSTSERLFEQHCELNENVEWYYKNGNTGNNYFSIVYIDGLNQKQHLFYPDYIVKMMNGDIWIIETKGGEFKGKNKNIDNMVKIKFLAFKQYAEKNNVNWGFVRDKNSRLLINNTNYFDDLSADDWKPIKEVFY